MLKINIVTEIENKKTQLTKITKLLNELKPKSPSDIKTITKINELEELYGIFSEQITELEDKLKLCENYFYYDELETLKTMINHAKYQIDINNKIQTETRQRIKISKDILKAVSINNLSNKLQKLLIKQELDCAYDLLSLDYLVLERQDLEIRLSDYKIRYKVLKELSDEANLELEENVEQNIKSNY